MNTEAFHQLKRVLSEVQSQTKPFDMRFWVGSSSEDEPITCGTSSCAAGWAARDPWFRDKNFVLSRGSVSYYRAFGFAACARFFDISDDTAEFIFSLPDTLEQVLDHIDQVLSGEYPPEEFQ